MRRTSFIYLIALVALGAIVAVAAHVDGTWTAKVPGREGQMQDMTFKLKAEGANLTGTVSGRGGDTAISDGRISGDAISFNVKREFGGRSMVFKYEGKVAGEEIQFKQTVEGMDRPPREFTAKKSQ
jgi:hypothetical protein